MNTSKKNNHPENEPPKNGVSMRTDALKEGMELAEDVTHFNGRLLLEKGVVLSARDIRIFKMWGITEARVLKEGETSKKEKDKEPDPEVVKYLVPFVEDHFRFAGLSHPLNREMYRLCLRHYAYSSERWRLAANFPKPREEGHEADRSMAAFPFDNEDEVIKNTRYPSLPQVVIRLNQAINDPRCTATHIAEIISKDAGLTARLLKLVNSPFYHFPTEITSIPRAVAIVGSRQLTMLALATVVTSSFKNIPPEYLSMESFWKHSIACGLIARLIASYKQNTNTEIFFLAGLLHDIGRLIIFQDFPAHAREILAQAAEHPGLAHHIEREILGIDHAELGGLLMKKWKLSAALENACSYHYMPMESQDPLLPAVVHVADIVATAMYFGNSGEYYVPPLVEEAWETIDLPISILSPTVTQAAQLLQSIVDFYMPENYTRDRNPHERMENE